jgi:hypothetical protein
MMEETAELGALQCVLFNRYYLDDQIEGNETGGTCRFDGKRSNAYRILLGIHEGKT